MLYTPTPPHSGDDPSRHPPDHGGEAKGSTSLVRSRSDSKMVRKYAFVSLWAILGMPIIYFTVTHQHSCLWLRLETVSHDFSIPNCQLRSDALVKRLFIQVCMTTWLIPYRYIHSVIVILSIIPFCSWSEKETVLQTNFRIPYMTQQHS